MDQSLFVPEQTSPQCPAVRISFSHTPTHSTSFAQTFPKASPKLNGTPPALSDSVKALFFRLLTPLLFATALPAQEDIAFTATRDGSIQRYVELLPPNFQQDQSADLVVALHGHGSDRWQFIKDARGECRGVREVAAKHGAILVSPDYRAKTSWMGPDAEADVLQILDEVQSRRKIRRTFLAGGSMGGTAAAIFTTLHPQRVHGFCSLNGTVNMLEYKGFHEAISASYGGTATTARAVYEARSPDRHPERLTMPAAFTTGGLDTVVPPDSTLKLVAALQSAGRQVYHIHRPNGGHSTTLADTTAAMTFLFTPNQPPAIPSSSTPPTTKAIIAPTQSATLQPIPESLLTRRPTHSSSRRRWNGHWRMKRHYFLPTQIFWNAT
jgi:pimeloyl-ACP methyl ester carboxylesterase